MKTFMMDIRRCATLAAVAVAALFAACEPDYTETDKGEEELKLTVSAKEVVLNQRTADNRALAFEWTSGSNRGTGAAIHYTFQMDVEGNGFAGGWHHEMGKSGARALNFTHAQLNDTIAKYWSALPREQAQVFEARVIADVASVGVEQQISNVEKVTLTSYTERTLNLYLIGSAAPNGWDNQLASAMDYHDDNLSLFTWSGPLHAGELKFITTIGSFDNYYSRGEDDNTLVYNGADDVKFKILEPADYDITIDVDALTVSITKKEGTERQYDRLYMIGSATAGGWNANKGTQMESLGEGKFSWSGVLSEGEMKFTVVEGLFAPSFGRGATDEELLFRSSDTEADANFAIAQTGSYTVTLDINALTVAIAFNGEAAISDFVGMVGEASMGGWSLDNMTALVRDDNDMNIFVYEGPLNAGDFRFSIDRSTQSASDWGNLRFIVSTAQTPSLADTSFDIVAGGDKNWTITEAGNYRIVINLKEKSISIEKQE